MALAISFRSAALTSALAVLSMASAHGAIGDVTVTTDPVMHRYGLNIQLAPDNAAGLKFSPLFIAATNSVSGQVEAIEPGALTSTLNSRNRYTSIQVDMPVTALFGTVPANGGNLEPLETSGFRLDGGLRILTEADGFTNSGGALSISNLQVGKNERMIYGDVEGGNGVGFIQQMALWQIGSYAGYTDMDAPQCDGMVCSTTLFELASLSELAITSDAFHVITTSLGLNENGISAMSKVTDYGTLVTTIPEPSSYLLMGLGLVGIGTVARRRATTH